MNQTTNNKRPINRTAVIRLIIWGVVLCLLVGTFALVLFAQSSDGSNRKGGIVSWGGYTYDNPESYSVGGGTVDATVNELDIEWLAGDIVIEPTDESAVTIEEDYSGTDDDLRLRWRIKNGRLSIKFRKSAWTLVGSGSENAKKLTVRIPRAMLEGMREVELDVVNVSIAVNGRINELNCDGVEADLTVNGHVGELDIDLVRGKLELVGTLGHADLDGVDMAATFRVSAARGMDIDGVRQNVTLCLADSVTGFTIRRESLGGKTETKGFDDVSDLGKGNRRWGDGSLAIEVDGVDASVTVEKMPAETNQ